MSYKLAICIPTYNRKEYLRICMEAIISEISVNDCYDSVQICVSDNCSTDGTAALVANFINNSGVDIIYYQNSTNIGPDLNFLKCIEISKADYCWFMGSDDVLIPGSIELVLKHISEYNCDTYVFNRTICDVNLVPKIIDPFFHAGNNEVYKLADDASALAYFQRSLSLGAVFSFLSSLIIKKTAWDSVEYDVSFTGTAYSHVSMILNYLLNDGSTVQLADSSIVFCRTGNDHFSQGGMKKRALIDINGYIKMCEIFHKKNKARIVEPFLTILMKEYHYYNLLKHRSFLTQEEWNDLYQAFINASLGYKELEQVNSLSIPFANAQRLAFAVKRKIKLVLSTLTTDLSKV